MADPISLGALITVATLTVGAITTAVIFLPAILFTNTTSVVQTVYRLQPNQTLTKWMRPETELQLAEAYALSRQEGYGVPLLTDAQLLDHVNSLCEAVVPSTSLPYSCLDTFYNYSSGVCLVSRLSEGTCDDGDKCSSGDRCIRGECIGKHISCADADPCTINSCQERDTKDCGPGKTACPEGEYICIQTGLLSNCVYRACSNDYNCPVGFVCNDGVCSQFFDVLNVIRMTNFEMEKCDTHSDRYRLVQDYLFTSLGYMQAEEPRFRLFQDASAVRAREPANFIEEVIGISTVMKKLEGGKNTYAETAFRLKTKCKEINALNCHTAFSMETYKFGLELDDCVNGDTSLCMNRFTTQEAAISTHYVNCPFNTHSEILVQMTLELSTYGESPQYNCQDAPSVDCNARATVVSNVMTPRISYASVCIVKPVSKFRDCALNKNVSGCPWRGCTWEGDNSPLENVVSFVVDGEVMPEHSSYMFSSCTNNIRCEECQNTMNTTWIDFSLFPFQGGDTIVVDITTELDNCDSNNRRLDSDIQVLSKERRINHVNILHG